MLPHQIPDSIDPSSIVEVRDAARQLISRCSNNLETEFTFSNNDVATYSFFEEYTDGNLTFQKILIVRNHQFVDRICREVDIDGSSPM